MEFRHPYLVAMQDQNPKMYRRLRDSGELMRFVQLKAGEAHRMLVDLLKDAPKGPNGQPTTQAEREAEEQVRAVMFEFPDDQMTPKQSEAKALFDETPPQQ